MLKIIIASMLMLFSVAQADTKVGIMGTALLSTTENDKVDDIAGSYGVPLSGTKHLVQS